MDLNQYYTQRRNEFYAKRREPVESMIIEPLPDQVSPSINTLRYDVEDLITSMRREYYKTVQQVLTNEGLLAVSAIPVIQAAQASIPETSLNSKMDEVLNAYFEFRLKHLFYCKTYPDGEKINISDF